MYTLNRLSKTVPLDIVGSTKFGRYPKISVEQTFNMIISDDFLVSYAGYNPVVSLIGGIGRGIFNSVRFGKLIVVIGQLVYVISPQFSYEVIGQLNTDIGDVFIDENEKNQITICDKQYLYFFDYSTNAFSVETGLDFTPGYIQYQNGYFISPDLKTPTWRLSDLVNTNTWPNDSNHVGTFQTKADNPVACIRLPGRQNNLLVIGSIVTQLWTNTAANLFPYQISIGFNIDYGCLNSASIAVSDQYVVWLAANEKSGPVIMYTNGGMPAFISTDGIDYKLSTLTNPRNCYGFLFKQDGHLIYQITFVQDNLSYAYDFNTGSFFSVSDTNGNAHIAKNVSFFNNSYYFISYKDGNLYEFSTKYTMLGTNEMPRIRITKPFRLPDQSRFVINNIGFTMEQGDNTGVYRVDLSLSKDGGETFGNAVSKICNQPAHFANRVNFWQLGACNDCSVQLRFWSTGRAVATNGVMSYYQ